MYKFTVANTFTKQIYCLKKKISRKRQDKKWHSGALVVRHKQSEKGKKCLSQKNLWKAPDWNNSDVLLVLQADPSKTISYRDVATGRNNFVNATESISRQYWMWYEKKERARFVKGIHNTAILWAIARAIYSTEPLQWLHSYGMCMNKN